MKTPYPVWNYQGENHIAALVGLVRAGVSAFPVNSKTKAPLVKWKRFQSEPPIGEDVDQWLDQFPNFAIGLVTGPVTGWVVVDVDDKKELGWVEENFPPTPVKQHTKRGVHYFYRQGNRTIPSKTKISGREVDIRGSGGFVVIAPSFVNEHWRYFEIERDVDIEAVPTLDDLENFEELMRVTSVRGGRGGDSHVIRDNETGLIIDGREGYLRDLTYALCNDIAGATRQLPEAQVLARAVWQRFEAEADLSDGRWQFEHALDKAKYLLGRIESGEIQFAIPEPAPNFADAPAFVSPEDAIEKLRGVLEEFLEYRAKEEKPTQVRHFLIKSPAGLGKTTNTIELAVEYILRQQRRWGPLDITMGMVLGVTPYPDDLARMLMYVRSHSLAHEIKAIIEKEYDEQDRQIDVPVWRGRQDEAENGNAPCVLWQQARLLQRSGYSVAGNLCQRRRGDELINCDHFEDCEYISTHKKHADFTVMMTAQLPYSMPTGLLQNIDADQNLPREERFFFRPTIDGRTFLIDENPVEYLRAERDLPIAAFDDLPNPENAKLILDGLNSADGLLTHLRANRFDAEQVRDWAKRCEDEEGEYVINIRPGNPAVEQVQRELGGKKVYRVSDVIHRLADELSSGRDGESYSLRKVFNDELKAQGRQRFPLAHMPGIVMDATADPFILRQFMPALEVAADIQIERNAFVTQVSDQTFSRHTLLSGPDAKENQDQVRQYIEAEANKIYADTEGRTLVITYMALRRLWTGVNEGKLPPSTPLADGSPVDVAHFGAIRGLDEFKNHEAIFIVGRQEPSPGDIEEQARALWYDTPDPIETAPEGEPLPRRDASVFVRGLGNRSVGRVSFHPDHRVDALLRQSREAESLQAIDRLRLVHNDEKKLVFLLCKIPLPGLVVDRLLTWDELLANGTKLDRVLKACDERGSCAVPLTPKWLRENHPDLWATEDAARRWLESRPQLQNRDYTYWGDLYRYRLAGCGGRKQWAIIKNGTEDPCAALSHTLGREVGSLEMSPVEMHMTIADLGLSGAEGQADVG